MKWLNDLNKRLGQCLDFSGDRQVIEEVQTRLQELFLEKDQESGKSLGEMLPLTSENEFLPEKEEDCPVTRGGLVCECDACSIMPGCSSTDQVK